MVRGRRATDTEDMKVGTTAPTALEERLKQAKGVTSTPPTPHRIELCQDIEDYQQNPPVSKHILTPKRIAPPSKGRRKLNNNLINQAATKNESNTKKITDFYPVRRSIRKTKQTVLEEKQKTLEHILRNNIEEGLKVHFFDGKGRGILASRTFFKGDFVVEYSGELIDINEAKRREQLYAQDQNTGCYMYYFKHKGQQYCIDATAETGKLGRLVNHSRNGNLITRTMSVDDKPRLMLIAKDDIPVGEEITYDYGDRSKEALKHHPWLAF